MDGQRFDRMARRLAGGVSRRAVLRGAAAGLAAAAGLRAGRAGAGQTKKSLCHATGDPAHPWVVIDVAEPAWDSHVAHGDHAYVDCCADAECTAPATCGGDGACVENTCDVDGAMACAGSGFVTCDRGALVYRDCGPGTVCRPLEGTIVCDSATGQPRGRLAHRRGTAARPAAPASRSTATAPAAISGAVVASRVGRG